MGTMTSRQERLALQLFDIGAIKFGAFRLKLHETHPDAPLSPIYLNLRTADNPKPGPITPEIVDEIGQQLYSLAQLVQISYSHVAGVPRAGDPFAEAFSRASTFGHHPPPLLRLRKDETPDLRHVSAVLEGTYRRGDRVLLIDDLITQAGSKLEAIRALRETGLVVHDVLVLVDREQGGSRQLQEFNCQLHAVFSLSPLLDLYLERGKIPQAMRDEVSAYLATNT
jgi:uridine monophosphate synthetase